MQVGDAYTDYMSNYGKVAATASNPWLALTNFLSAPPQGRTIYEQSTRDTTKIVAVCAFVGVVGIFGYMLARKQ